METNNDKSGTKGRETGSNTTGGARDAWEPPMIPTND